MSDWKEQFKEGYVVKRKSTEYPTAWFQYAVDAQDYVNRQTFPGRWDIIDQVSSHEVVGTNGHGLAILSILQHKKMKP